MDPPPVTHESAPLLSKPAALPTHDAAAPTAADAGNSESRTLIYACVLTTIFFLVELFGGWLAGSLAIMSDAAHLLSDLAGFAISLVAVSVSRLPANEYLSFGFARAEVLGAFVSVLFIWALTVVLVLFAIERLFNPQPVHGPLMLLLGVIGLAVNLGLGLVLGHGGHGHSHGAHDHGPAHEHVNHGAHAHDVESQAHKDGHDHDHDDEHDHGHNASESNIAKWWSNLKAALTGDDSRSVNLRAAYLHVLGDTLQNVGVVIAAIAITIRPDWSFIDPFCTLLFAVIVIMTTAGLAKETLYVLMEGTPPELQLSDIYDSLRNIAGVSRVGDLHVWSISPRNPALSVHLYKTAEAAGHEILKAAQGMLDLRFNISHATVQINCETTECCDEEKYLAKGNKKNCVTSHSLQIPNGTA